MLHDIIHLLLFEISYFELYFIVFGYFLLLYFGIAPIFLTTSKLLEHKGYLSKIIQKQVSTKQVQFEIKYSLQSILIFGISAHPVIYGIRNEWITLLPNTFTNVIAGLIILTIWNEVHFFIVHRIMHTPFFLKRVHVVHHKSIIPTVYSVYSFHWLEAFLLSTVPITIVPFINFSPLAIFLYPLVSILFNFCGHCNYRFGSGNGAAWKLFGTKHNEHHAAGRKNYGFISGLPDKIYQLFN